jgi:hypothetical protein
MEGSTAWKSLIFQFLALSKVQGHFIFLDIEVLWYNLTVGGHIFVALDLAGTWNLWFVGLKCHFWAETAEEAMFHAS